MKKRFILFLLFLGCGGEQGELPDLFLSSSSGTSSSSSSVASSSSSGKASSSSSGKVSSSSSSGASSSSSSGASSSSSSGASSSSSSVVSSSSSPTVTCGEEIYETIGIGTQTWFKRNLNCGDGTSNDPYGKLYEWEKAKKACPKGWHLPTAEDWYKLMKVLDSESKEPPYEDEDIVSETVGESLANSEWNSGYAGNCGNWWSATANGDFALNWSLCKGSGAIKWYNNHKSNLFSVRCLKDN